MRIHVTREDIENGRVRDAQNCPVAIALRRAGVAHFGVSGMLVWVASGHRAVVLPGSVQQWILNYDYGMQMTPVDFDLHLPEESEAAAEHIRPLTPSAFNRPVARRNTLRATSLPHAGRGSRPEQTRELETVGK